MEVRASVSGVRVSPRKARLVVDAVRGKRVMDAHRAHAVHAAEDGARRRQAAAVGRGERREQLRPGSGGSLDQGDLCRRGAVTIGDSRRRRSGRVGRIIRRSTHITVIAEERRR